MRRSASAILAAHLIFALSLPADTAACPSGDRPIDSLVAAERAFASLAAAKDTRTAFLWVLDDSAVMFRPHPVNGVALFSSQPVRPTLLAWAPSFADISAGGECGYTFGPWTIAQRATPDSILAHGHFVTFWRKSKGIWKVLLDAGISHPPPAGPSAGLVLGKLSRDARPPAAKDSGEEGGDDRAGEGRAEEDRYHANLRALPIGVAVRRSATDDLRLFRDELPPLSGIGNGYLDTLSGYVQCRRIRMWHSEAGDLACSYGTYERLVGGATAEHGYYVRMWRRDAGMMRMALELWSALPLTEEPRP